MEIISGWLTEIIFFISSGVLHPIKDREIETSLSPDLLNTHFSVFALSLFSTSKPSPDIVNDCITLLGRLTDKFTGVNCLTVAWAVISGKIRVVFGHVNQSETSPLFAFILTFTAALVAHKSLDKITELLFSPEMLLHPAG